MVFLSWRKALRQKSFLSNRARQRPMLEVLEDRLAPATFHWTGNGADNRWNNSQNWLEGTPGILGTDTLIFGPNAAQKTAANDFTNASFAAIQFTGSGFTLVSGGGTSPLTLTGANAIVDMASGTNQIKLPTIQMGANQTFKTTVADAILAFESTVLMYTAAPAASFALTFDGPGTIDLRLGALDDVSGGGSVVKQGTGTTIIQTQNHYSGDTTVAAGIYLIRASDYGLGDPDNGIGQPKGAGGTTVLSGATLQLGDSVHSVTTRDETLYLAGDGFNGLGALYSSVGNNTVGTTVAGAQGGNIYLTTPVVTINVATGSTLDDVKGIKDDPTTPAGEALTKIGGGTLIFDGSYYKTELDSAANTYTGLTWVKDGTLDCAKTTSSTDKSIRGDTRIGDDIGAPLSARLIQRDSFQFDTGQTNTINSDGQMEFRYSGEAIGKFIINHGNLNLPNGVSVTSDSRLQMTGGSVTSNGTTPTSPVGVLNINGELRTIQDPATAVISANLGLSPASVSFFIGDGAANPDLDIQGKIVANSGNLIVNGPGQMRLGNSNPLGGIIQLASSVTLLIGNNGALGTTELQAGGSTIIADGGARTLNNTLRMTGDLSVTGPNDLAFTKKAFVIGGPGEQRNITVAGPGIFTFGAGLGETAGSAIQLNKLGVGTLRFQGTSDYAGITNINAGTVLVDGALAATGTVNVVGGTLGGTGRVGNVFSTATVAPGDNAPGHLTASNATFAAGSTFNVELNGPTAFTQYDQLSSNGNVTLTSPDGNSANFPVLNVVFGPGFQSASGQSFTILTKGSAGPIATTNGALFRTPSGQVLTEGAIFTPVGAPAGQKFQITYQGGDGNDVVIGHLPTNPTILAINVAPNPVVVNNPVALTGSFSDPDTLDTHTVSVNWGDGTTTTVNLAAGVTTIGPLSHTYPSSFVQYPATSVNALITVTLTDSGGGVASAQISETVTRLTSVPGTFDSVGVFDPTAGRWYLRNSNSAGAANFDFFFGLPNWKPVAGDWNGDGVTSIGVVNPSSPRYSTWYLRNANSAGAADAGSFVYGLRGWIPVAGDWDGNGTTSIGMFDPSSGFWYLRNSNSAGGTDYTPFQFGAPGWIPVVGDWDGNGTTTIGIVDPATNSWYLRNSNSAGGADAGFVTFGAPGWKPVTGDWTGIGRTGIGVFDPAGNWYLRDSATSGLLDNGPFAYGAGSWAPVAGTWALGLRAGGGTNSTNPSLGALGQAELNGMVAGALARLRAAGVDANVVDRLAGTQFAVGNLGGATLGLAIPDQHRVVISANAAGYGWYVDATALTDTEFPSAATAGRMDLLTAVLHEMGHLNGRSDLENASGNDLMADVLASGTRHTGNLDAAFARGF